jgi:hypothetical protein
MKHIAIVGSFNYHLECIGFLLEIFKNDKITIYIKKDKYKWIDYYNTLYNFNIIYNKINNEILKKYELIIKLSANDKCIDNKKIISILHLHLHHKEYGRHGCISQSKKYICLTPNIQGPNIYYTFPIFKPVLKNSINSKMITFIGTYYNKDFDKDIIDFIKNNNDFTFNFILNTRGKLHKYNNIKNIKNINIYNKIDTFKMVNIINDSKFILSKKCMWHDRFSGCLNLAMSFEKPIIIDKKTKDDYKLPSISFNKNYMEIGKIKSISDNEYNNIIKDIKIFNKNAIDNNNKILTLENLKC